MDTQPVADPSSKPAPAFVLLVLCVECGQGVELAFPIDQRSIALVLAQNGWFVSVLSPPDQGPTVPVVLGPLCSDCAPQVYPPEVFKFAEEQRQRLLQAVQAVLAAQGEVTP